MSGTLITIAIFGIICLCVGAIYVTQARERARVEKIRKINALTNRHQRMQQLLHDVPPQYLNNELRILITERSIESLTELIKLKNNSRLTKEINQDQEFLKQLREQNPKFTPVPIKNEASSKGIRELLEILYRFIEAQHKRKRLDAPTTKKYLGYVGFFICQSKADMFSSRAEAANTAGKPRSAIHNYHEAITVFKELTNNPEATKVIIQYQSRIKELEQVAGENNLKVKKPSQEQPGGNQEWDKFLDDDDQWQKKNTYDD